LRQRNFSDQAGNAVIEFVGFAFLVYAPIATFAATDTIKWIQKIEVTTSATQLARAYAIGPEAFRRLELLLQSEYQGLTVGITTTKGFVEIRTRIEDQVASARQFL
jgi:hypothetical protein